LQLFSRKIGSGYPAVILHGLFGMSDNWVSIAKELAHHGFGVHLLDLRNHGRSPHTLTHTYKEMCEDLLSYFRDENITRACLVGHSMGGKLAMWFGLLYPEKLSHLTVVDIAPSNYSKHNAGYHSNIIHNLMAIDLAAHQNRSTLLEEIRHRLNDYRLTMFLGKSIQRDENKCFTWKLNLPVLLESLPLISRGLDELDQNSPCGVQTLFVRGEKSDYIQAHHEKDRMKYFPESSVTSIAGAGHWLHIEQPDRLVTALIECIVPKSCIHTVQKI
jgi:esterase